MCSVHLRLVVFSEVVGYQEIETLSRNLDLLSIKRRDIGLYPD